MDDFVTVPEQLFYSFVSYRAQLTQGYSEKSRDGTYVQAKPKKI